MRVLLLFPMADGQTGPAIQHAFLKLGHTVLSIDAKLEPDNSCPSAYVFKPDLVFCSRTYTLAEQVKAIQQKFPNVTVCMWNTDTRNSIQEWYYLFPLIKLCDYYFVIATNQIPDWQKINPNTFWLPQGLQEEVYHKPDGINKSDILKYECDVSFAGSCTGYHAWRVPYLRAIERMGLNFKEWGCEGQPQVYNEEHNKMVACSKINLGMSGWPGAGRNVSVRDYKIMGAGGFLLEHWQDGIFEVMQPGMIGIYKDIESLKYQVEFWLKHEDVRQLFIQNGYQWVHASATYTKRVERALEIMKLG